MPRKRYTKEFKAQAVDLVRHGEGDADGNVRRVSRPGTTRSSIADDTDDSCEELGRGAGGSFAINGFWCPRTGVEGN
ncbi:MAG: hypothetical protein CMO80_08795 [Verrucomicrobiales bacterium]|nr:hypothetical protein [Verrucomicrobiales bacterium]